MEVLQEEKNEMDLALERDTVGIIDWQTAELIGLPMAGAVILTENYRKHIEKGHGSQIRNAGFNNAKEFVRHILEHIDAVYQDPKGSYSFVTQEARLSRVATRLEVTKEDSGNYVIKTAHPIRMGYYDKNTPLWERTHTNQSQMGTPRVDRARSGAQFNFTANLQNVKDVSEEFQNQHLKDKYNFQEQLQNDLKKLEGLHQGFLKARQERIPSLEKAHKKNTREIEALTQAIELRDKSTGLAPVMYVNGCIYGVKEERVLVKEVLAPAARKSARNKRPQAIGKYRGFDVLMQSFGHGRGTQFFIQNPCEPYTTPELRYEGKDSFKLADFSKRLDKCLERLETRQKKALLRGIRLDRELEAARTGQGFPQMEMLKALRSDNFNALLEMRKLQKDPAYKSSWEPKSRALAKAQEKALTKAAAPAKQPEKDTSKEKGKDFGR